MKRIDDAIKAWEYEDIASISEADLLHDVNFNNKRKIEVEHSFAQAIIELPTPEMLANIHRVSTVILPFIQYIRNHDNDTAKGMYDVFMRHLGANSDQFARDDSLGEECESISEACAKETLLSWLEAMLVNVTPMPNELLSIVRIHLAADYVLFDYLLKPNQGCAEISQSQQEVLNVVVPDSTFQEKIKSSSYNNQGLETLRCEAYIKRGRINRNKDRPLTRQFGLFPIELRQEKQLPLHRRGMDLFRVRAHYQSDGESQSKYVDIAVHNDMPMVCSISTTALRLLRFAAALTTMSVKDYWDYALPHLSYNILGGHHTFHEYASVMALVGVPYQVGSYISLFFEKSPVNTLLRNRYSTSLIGENASVVAEIQQLEHKCLSEALLEIDQSYGVSAETVYRVKTHF